MSLNSHLGIYADMGNDADMTTRLDAMNAQYCLYAPLFGQIQPTATTFDWTEADRVIGLNIKKFRKIIWRVHYWPDWLAAIKTQPEFVAAVANHVKQVGARYGKKIWCMQVHNEPLGPSGRAWKDIPGVTDDGVSMNQGLIALYKAAKSALSGTGILLGGPAFGSFYWYQGFSDLMRQGAFGVLDVCIIHNYAGALVHPDETKAFSSTVTALPYDVTAGKWWKACSRGMPIVAAEIGLYGASASSAKYPNTDGSGNANSGYSEEQGVRDAVLTAVLMRRGGVDVLIPHVLNSSGSQADNNLEIYGYEYYDGSVPWGQLPMKLKTAAFLAAVTP